MLSDAGRKQTYVIKHYSGHSTRRQNIAGKLRLRQRINRCRKKSMSPIYFLLSSYYTVDNDIIHGDIMKLRAFVCQLGDQIVPKATEKP